MAGMDHFELVIKGEGGHTASPQYSIDPIVTAANVIQGVKVIQTRELDILNEPVLIMFGMIEGGSASNVIPDKVKLSGMVRHLYSGDENSEDHPKKRFERIISNICSAHRADYNPTYPYSQPTLVNNPKMAKMIGSVASEDLATPQNIVSFVSMAGEDFSEFTARVPGAFYLLGTGDPEKESHYPHRHPKYNIDEDVLAIGVEMHVQSAIRYLAEGG